jgi:hypothetical protein
MKTKFQDVTQKTKDINVKKAEKIKENDMLVPENLWNNSTTTPNN